MRNRRLVLLLIGMAVVLTLFSLWWYSNKSADSASATLTETNVTSGDERESHAPSPSRVVPTNAPAMGATTAVPNPQTAPRESSGLRKQGILSTYNHVPIDFYGKLVDQFGTPVAGADIKGSIRVINGFRRGTDWLSTTSGADGRFEFHGKGQDIGVAPTKAGYVYLTMNGTGNYSLLSSEEERAHPDPSSPVILKMWKLQGAQHLISFRIDSYVPVNGTPVIFDLHTGTRVEQGGDLTIRLESPAKPNAGEGYDWRVSVQPMDGGIFQPRDIRPDQMFEAPETGYEKEFDLAYRNGASPWSSRFKSSFYFSTRAGRCYGKLTLSITTDVVREGGALVMLSGYLNPTGFRNLEMDPALVTPAHP
jgi:hypothetical protein